MVYITDIYLSMFSRRDADANVARMGLFAIYLCADATTNTFWGNGAN